MLRTTPENDLSTAGSRLDHLVAELSARIEAGEPIDLSALTADCPEHREQLEMLLPTLQAVVDLDQSLAETPARDSRTTSERTEAVSGVLGDFRILREIGRGGMGVVYEAEQLSIGRRVALKVLPFAAMLDRQQLNRFKNEARAAGTLDHSNIVAIHSVGCERGVHYYAMQLIEGQSIAQVIDTLRTERAASPPTPARAVEQQSGSGVEEQRSSGVEQSAIRNPKSEIDTAPIAHLSTLPDFNSKEYYRSVASLGIQAAEALDHAHQNGILHRDIKPANLLVDDTGKLWITDFGLARIEQDAGMTLTGDVLGTLRYMSPEQALAKRAVVDQRSDIYSLGITLYELLALQPAFAVDDRQELLRKIAFEDPKQLRTANDRIPQDLETIVLKAIEKEPHDRYATAQDLADDLRRFIAHQPIRARSATLLRRLTKWSRRHAAIVAAVLTTLFLALTVTSVVVALANRSEREQRKLAQAAQQHAEMNLSLAREAVDEMLTKVASTWVADSMATSVVQRQFLERALEIYQQLATSPTDGNVRGTDVATAHERIADIHHHIGNSEQTIASLQTAVEMLEELAASAGTDTAHSETLVRCYRKLARALSAQSKLDEAERETDKGVKLAQQLVKDPDVPLQQRWEVGRELGRLLAGRAELLMNSGKIADATAVIEQPEVEQAERLAFPDTAPLESLVLGAEVTKARSTILFRQGRFDDALKAANSGTLARAMFNSNFSDAKQLLELSAELHEIVGEIRLAQGKAAEAVEAFRGALELRRERLGGRTPIELSRAIFKNEAWRYGEPRAVADYCATQLRLATALTSAGRPYEAESILGDALMEASVLNDTFITEVSRGNLRFWVLHANAAAAVGQRLSERGSPEASHFLQLAGALWSEMRLQFPQAELFQSGAHGVMRDWDWFRSRHSDIASRPGTRESLKLDDEQTAFWTRTRARFWFQHGDDSGNGFAKAAELRDGYQAYDRLHMAMVHERRGEPEKAKSEYDRAIAEMKAIAAPDAELESLRRTAERTLAEDINQQTASPR
jgi:serine/threonine protein kinase